MARLPDPYTIRYPFILAVDDGSGNRIELIEQFECIGGAMWASHHYRKSPLVESVRNVGNTMRYIISPGTVDLPLQGSSFPAGITAASVDRKEIRISYEGLGGGGVGAAVCRGSAGGVLRSTVDPSGGGKRAGSTVHLPRRTRVLIGIDDTDTPEEGATWTLAHRIAQAVAGEANTGGDHVYLTHTIVQLFPVSFRTKNCVAVVCEFATSDPSALAARFSDLLVAHTLSKETGMAVYTGFDPSPLQHFSDDVRRGQVEPETWKTVSCPDLSVRLSGRGITGAIAAIPWYTRFEEAAQLWNGQS